MKITKTTLLFTTVMSSAVLLATGALAQTTSPAAAPSAAIPPAGAMPAPNSIIYIPRLPTVDEVSKAAAAQGLAIAKMEQTSDHLTVVYRYADGHLNTVSYQLLATATAATATVVAPPPTVVVPAPAPTVIYRYPGYYDDPFWGPDWDDFDDDAWYPPLSIGLGFSYHSDHFRDGDRHFGGRGFRR